MSECLIHPRPAGPGKAALARFASLPTSAVSDSMRRLVGAPGVLPLIDQCRVVGPALTVKTRPGDNLVVHKAADLARPGDVLVIDAGGDTTRAIVGDLLCRYATSREIAGIVLDGAARDVAELGELGLPVFARAISHLGPYKNGPGEIGRAVSIAGMTVRSGDVVVGDADGVVAVPAAHLDTVATAAEALLRAEAATVAAINDGNWDRSWIDASLNITWFESKES
ncbi:hypothetical protein OU415_34770 [Saccharopolyspora sp. WRP15-2]|uniref:Putative 4-hydroxy-4-methyl-2-oxoglutarate aldolase n=1 Tax=Saccharopolyspora oryzae TaxID=2997343 RepID=A0ABT4V9N7_9PSEU|nr:hypothetical protein [Saccharopolyspora oryzae]MDA3630638.1 hypothetical protein [Saccharopolyspora oryzae]